MFLVSSLLGSSRLVSSRSHGDSNSNKSGLINIQHFRSRWSSSWRCVHSIRWPAGQANSRRSRGCLATPASPGELQQWLNKQSTSVIAPNIADIVPRHFRWPAKSNGRKHSQPAFSLSPVQLRWTSSFRIQSENSSHDLPAPAITFRSGIGFNLAR